MGSYVYVHIQVYAGLLHHHLGDGLSRFPKLSPSGRTGNLPSLGIYEPLDSLPLTLTQSSTPSPVPNTPLL